MTVKLIIRLDLDKKERDMLISRKGSSSWKEFILHMTEPRTTELILYRKMRKMSNGRRFIGHHDVMEIMKRFLPFFSHSLYYPIIKDFEKDNLIRKIDKTKYEHTGGNADAPLNKYNCQV